MSYGLMCLGCRRYIHAADPEWRCECSDPQPSFDGKTLARAAEPDEYEDDGSPDDPERKCFHCGGEGWDECHDPIQCTNAHSKDGLCRCAACGGSGLAKDMTIW